MWDRTHFRLRLSEEKGGRLCHSAKPQAEGLAVI
jgi:hypothetical protein